MSLQRDNTQNNIVMGCRYSYVLIKVLLPVVTYKIKRFSSLSYVDTPRVPHKACYIIGSDNRAYKPPTVGGSFYEKKKKNCSKKKKPTTIIVSYPYTENNMSSSWLARLLYIFMYDYIIHARAAVAGSRFVSPPPPTPQSVIRIVCERFAGVKSGGRIVRAT